MEKCPLCDKEDRAKSRHGQDVFDVVCDVCGSYGITGDLRDALPCVPQWAEKRHLLSGLVREANLAGTVLPDLTPEVVEALLPLAPRSVGERLSRFLSNISRMTTAPSEFLSLKNVRDYPLVFASPGENMHYYCSALEQLGHVSTHLTSGCAAVQITPKGWDQLAKLHPRATSSTAFVAMSFDTRLRFIYDESIAPAVRACGFEPVRVDYIHHNDLCIDRIIGLIRASRFVIADLTGGKHGVYFEAGYAMGLGIPVIWTCRKRQKVHFDVQQYNRIIWDDPAQLNERLVARILAVIGRGPLK